MRENEIEEHLLLGIKAAADNRLGIGSSFLAGQRRHRVSHMGEYVEQITFLSVNDLLHLRQLVMAKSFFRKTLQQFLARAGIAPQSAELSFIFEELRQLAK